MYVFVDYCLCCYDPCILYVQLYVVDPDCCVVASQLPLYWRIEVLDIVGI